MDPLLFQTDIEHETLINDNLRPPPKDESQEYKAIGLFPKNVGRNYGALKGLEKFIKRSVKPENQITLVGVEVQTIFKSKTTKVLLYQIGAKYVVVKKTIDPMKKIEFIHEAFIGKYVINNLLKICPNFVFVLGYRDEPYISYMYSDYALPCNSGIKENTVLQEYVKGPTLQEFLKNCTMKSYLEILLSLNCALLIAQNIYGFVHHDLKPWNIVVNILPEPIILEYYLRTENNQELVYKIKTKYIPIIIDYGKSHVIYNNVHYGVIEPYSVNKYIDLATLLLSTINELVIKNDGGEQARKENIQQNGYNEITQDLLFLVNFLSIDKIATVSGLKSFLFKTKKFGNLDKNNLKLELKTSKTLFEEFFKYMIPMIKKYKISFGKDNLTFDTWSSNARQIADMGFGLEVEDKIDSYLEVVRRIYKNPLPQAINRFTTIMIAQKMFDGLLKPKMEFVEYANQLNLNQKKVESVLKEFNIMEKFLMDFYTKQLNKKIREPFSIGVNQEQYKDVLKFEIKPSRRLFLESLNVKEKIRENMVYLPAQFPDYIRYRSLILDVLKDRGPFRMNDDDKTFYLDNFKFIFDEEFVSKVVNIETIRFFLNI